MFCLVLYVFACMCGSLVRVVEKRENRGEKPKRGLEGKQAEWEGNKWGKRMKECKPPCSGRERKIDGLYVYRKEPNAQLELRGVKTHPLPLFLCSNPFLPLCAHTRSYSFSKSRLSLAGVSLGPEVKERVGGRRQEGEKERRRGKEGCWSCTKKRIKWVAAKGKEGWMRERVRRGRRRTRGYWFPWDARARANEILSELAPPCFVWSAYTLSLSLSLFLPFSCPI